MNIPDHVTLITKYLTNSISENEEIELNDWLNEDVKHPKIFVDYHNIWEEAKTIGSDFETNEEEALQSFLEKIIPSEPVPNTEIIAESTLITQNPTTKIEPTLPVQETQPTTTSIPSSATASKKTIGATTTTEKSNSTAKWLKWAAIIVGVCGIAYFAKDNIRITQNMITIQTGDQVRTIKLPDGTLVSLNKHSTLIYDKNMKSRDLELHGEAYFDVLETSGSEFKIKCNGAKVVAEGENFGVRAYDEEDLIEVAIKEGKATLEAVNVTGNNILKVESGHKGVFNKEGEKQQISKNDNPTQWAWKDGKLEFHNQTLSTIFETIERYYEVEIELSKHSIGKCVYTKTFEEMEVKPLLEILAKDKKLKLKETETGFLLSGYGCGTRMVDTY